MIRPLDPSEPSTAVQKIHDFMAAPRPGLRYSWIPTLDKHLEIGGLTAVKLEQHPISPGLESFHNRLKLLTCEEAISLAPQGYMTGELRKLLGEAYGEMRGSGAGLTSGFVLAVGMKPK